VSGPAAAQSVPARLQQSVINPVVRLAWNLKIPIPGDALLETTGRRSHLPRRTPVYDGLDGETFWLIAQRGHDADWVRNIEANLRVRVKVSGIHTGWRYGTAHILDDDDPEDRRRILSQASLAPPSAHVNVEGGEHEPADNSRRVGQRMSSFLLPLSGLGE